MLWTRLFAVVAVCSSALALPVKPIPKRDEVPSVTRTFQSGTAALKGIQSQMAPYTVPGSTAGPQLVSQVNKIPLVIAGINIVLKTAENNPSAMLLDSDGKSMSPAEVLKAGNDLFQTLISIFSMLKNMQSITQVKDGLIESQSQLETMEKSLQATKKTDDNGSGLSGGLLGGAGGGLLGGLLGPTGLLGMLLGPKGILGGLLGGGGLIEGLLGSGRLV